MKSLAIRGCAVLCFVAAIPFVWQLVAWDMQHDAPARPCFFSFFTEWGVGRVLYVMPVLLIGGSGVFLWQKGAELPKK